ncbi:MAG: hypothetical protein QOE45_1037 [Frankiaceae bacterium]|nr:hypothetical protein [Frankiaceae bacterium]
MFGVDVENFLFINHFKSLMGIGHLDPPGALRNLWRILHQSGHGNNLPRPRPVCGVATMPALGSTRVVTRATGQTVPMGSVNAAKVRQDRKLAFVPVWPVVAAFIVVAFAVWLAVR